MFDCADCRAQTLHRQRAKLGYLIRRVLIGGRTPRRSQYTFGAAGPPRCVGVLRGSYRINYTVYEVRSTIDDILYTTDHGLYHPRQISISLSSPALRMLTPTDIMEKASARSW
jgi:hypothetical protein